MKKRSWTRRRRRLRADAGAPPLLLYRLRPSPGCSHMFLFERVGPDNLLLLLLHIGVKERKGAAWTEEVTLVDLKNGNNGAEDTRNVLLSRGTSTDRQIPHFVSSSSSSSSCSCSSSF
ncbi:unnamed protein product [Pleuronectes platessa]|uniref:Uncharacterized protein n=1 Tax=Pleuronectes platessa TaxID=8262 RepID=A0A9N7YJR4_PLEPL|nr:unnamed protein product [Pleuronectes platessa]